MSAGSTVSRWKAIRWALLGPMPGSRPSSSIRSWTGPSYIPYPPDSEAGQAEPAAAETAGQGPEPFGGHLLRGRRRVLHRPDHQVLQGLHVLRVDHLRIDLQGHQLTRAAHGRPHEPAAG